MIFHILTDIEPGKPCQLQKYIDNINGDKKIGLKKIIHHTDRYIIRKKTFIMYNDEKLIIEPGIYSFEKITSFFRSVGFGLMERGNYIELRIPYDSTVLLENTILSAINAEEIDYSGISHEKFTENDFAGELIKTKGMDVMLYLALPRTKIPREFRVCLEQLNTESNFINGAPSTIMEISPVPEEYGKIIYTKFENVSFKKLRGGCITELTVLFKDENNKLVENIGQITVELCIK